MPAVALAARQDPRTTDRIEQWWGDHFASAEYRAGEGGYPQMSDTDGSGRDGQSLSGNHRVPRMRYSGGGVELRMPAAAAVRRYADQLDGATFDVPVTAEVVSGDGPVQVAGWVRVVPRPAGGYSTTAVALEGEVGERMAEAVGAVLESRRPRAALRQVGDLLERRRGRESGSGAPLVPVDSSWVAAVGYDEANGIMAMQTRTGALYGHEVSRARFEAVVTAHSPGAQFNQIIRGNTRAQVAKCEQCGQFYAAAREHVCPVVPSAPSTEPIEQNAAARRAAAAATAPALVAGDVSGWVARRLALRGGARTGMYGPPGFTAALAGPLEEFTSSRYLPKKFGPAVQGEGRTRSRNGSGDVMWFEGLHGPKAMQLGRTLSERQRKVRQAGGPTAGDALLASTRFPGEVEAFGYMVGADREDERFTVRGVMLYAEDLADEQAAVEAARARYRLGSQVDPVSVRQVTPPWAGGRKAWRLTW